MTGSGSDPAVDPDGSATDTASRSPTRDDSITKVSTVGSRTSVLLGYRRLARWLKRDGLLGAGWRTDHATDFIWSLTSVQTYDQLVVERRLSIEQYATLLRTSLRTTLTADLPNGALPR